MNYSVNKETLLKLIDDGKALVRVELWASSSEDVPAYDAIPGKVLAEGSVAVIVSESKFVILDFDHTWKEWNPGAEGGGE